MGYIENTKKTKAALNAELSATQVLLNDARSANQVVSQRLEETETRVEKLKAANRKLEAENTKLRKALSHLVQAIQALTGEAYDKLTGAPLPLWLLAASTAPLAIWMGMRAGQIA